MNRIILQIFSWMLVILCSCSQVDLNGESGGGNPDIVFSLELQHTGYDELTFIIRHNGTNRNTYIIFATEDLESPVHELCQQYVSDNIKDIDGLVLDQKKKVYTLTGLMSNTEYRVIVTGADAEGNMYGVPCEVKVVTDDRTWQPELNEAWTLSYWGEETLTGTTASSLVRIEVAEGSTDVFCLLAFSESYFNSFPDISDPIEITVKNFVDKAEGDWWENSTDLYRGSVTTQWNLYRGDWIILAAGLTSDGKPTGKYNISELISPELKNTAPYYYQWLGKWQIEGTDIVLTLKDNKPNSSFLLCGWNGSDEDMLVKYHEATDKISISCQYLSDKILEVDGIEEDCSCYLRGLLDYDDGWSFFSKNNTSYVIAEGVKSDDAITMTGALYEANDKEYVFESMGFVAWHKSSDTYYIYYNRADVVFPIRLVRL